MRMDWLLFGIVNPGFQISTGRLVINLPEDPNEYQTYESKCVACIPMIEPLRIHVLEH